MAASAATVVFKKLTALLFNFPLLSKVAPNKESQTLPIVPHTIMIMKNKVCQPWPITKIEAIKILPPKPANVPSRLITPFKPFASFLKVWML